MVGVIYPFCYQPLPLSLYVIRDLMDLAGPAESQYFQYFNKIHIGREDFPPVP
jgi:hypothetical protein